MVRKFTEICNTAGVKLIETKYIVINVTEKKDTEASVKNTSI